MRNTCVDKHLAMARNVPTSAGLVAGVVVCLVCDRRQHHCGHRLVGGTETRCPKCGGVVAWRDEDEKR